jgi:hypothetical protein
MTLGTDTDVDQRAIATWRRTTSPAWLPRSRAQLGDDTAAALSAFRPPARWRAVDIRPTVDGHFTMTVHYRQGYPTTVLLSDRDAVGEVSRLVNDHVRLTHATPADRRRLAREWRGARFTVTITGTDPRARVEPAPSTPRGPRGAFPRKRAA